MRLENDEPAGEEVRSSDRVLHRRLLQGDPLASSDLAVAYLEPLVRYLRSAFRTVSPEIVETVADDLILSLAEKPAQYDPTKLSLTGYLWMAAHRDVSNALRSAKRRAAHEVSLDADVELARRLGNTVQDDFLHVVADADQTQRDAHALLTAARQHFDDREWAVVELMLDGERRTAVYARLLGLDERDTLEQAREVKRVKDRMQKRLQRLGAKVLERG